MTVWVSRELILAIHDEQIARHGGASGLRESGLLDSAVARPLNHAGYGDPDVVELGALYALAIARNHPFIDGNKRAAFMAMIVFFELNGVAFWSPDPEMQRTLQAEAVMTVLGMASGDIDDETFLAWVRHHARPA